MIFDHVWSQNGPYLAKEEKCHNIFFLIFNSKWQTTKKMIKNWKNIGGKSTHFRLGPKSWIGHWDPCFTLRLKIFVFPSTFWYLLLILVPNRNFVHKRFMQWFGQSWKSHLLSVNREWVMVTIHVNDEKFRFSLDDVEQAIKWTL